MVKIIFSIFFMVSLFVVHAAQAQMDISVGAVQRYFLVNKAPFQTLKVANNNYKDTYELTAHLDIYTNLDDVNRKTAKFEPAGNDFMFAPKRFVLKSKTSRAVRLVRTKPFGEKERVYRLSFKPKTVVLNEHSEAYVDAIKMGIGSNTTGGMLVWVSPKNVDFNVTVSRTEEGVTFFNEGNITAEVRQARKYCYKSKVEDGCISLPTTRLSPGEKWFFKVADHIPLVWKVISYETYKKIFKIPAFK